MITRRMSLLFVFILLAGCGGPQAVVMEATLVRVTPLATNTAVPPTTASAPTETRPPEPLETSEPEALTPAEQMEAFLASRAEFGQFSGVALVARSDEIIFLQSYGLADREHEIPNTPQTRFLIGTLTVPFTAMGIMQLQEQGRLDIGDSICDYLADCPDGWSAVQIQHLLTQSSGIPAAVSKVEYWEESGTYALPQETIARIEDGPLMFEPGLAWVGKIDKPSYLLLGLIIESASGQPYETFLRENIFDPLGMSDTALARDNPDRANSYITPDYPDPAVFQDMTPYFSAAGLMSTMNDMYLWGQALLQNKLVSAETMDAIFTFYTPMDGQGDDFHTGLGWFMSNFDGEYYSASMPGVDASAFKADMVVLPEEDLMWIILANQGVDSSYLGDTLIRLVLAEEYTIGAD